MNYIKLSMYLLIASVIFFPSQGAEVKFEANLSTIKCGQSVTLKWETDSSASVYLLNVGKVLPKGEKQVKPLRTTTYTLLAESSSGLQSKSLTIKVDGCIKGPDDYPDYNDFREQLSETRSTSSFVNFIDQTYRVLQDRMYFSVRSSQSPDGPFVFITRVSQREIAGPDDQSNHIGARRISYLVEVRELGQSQKITYTIKTFLQYRKKLEDTWRPEGNDSISRAEAEKLRDLLNTLP